MYEPEYFFGGSRNL